MRIGYNPVKNRYSNYSPSKIGIASITFVPFMEGFFKDSLDVIDVHLKSICQSMPKSMAYDLLVFDNGSCDEVTYYLKERFSEGMIDWLILSNHNMGKTGALNWIFSAMPNDYIAYSDSDVFFRSGWLQKSLEIFQAYKKAGIVSAQPSFFDVLRGRSVTSINLKKEKPEVKLSNIEPFPQALKEFCDGIGASEEVRQQLRENFVEVAFDPGTETFAVIGATHMQFTISRELAKKLIPLPASGVLEQQDDLFIHKRTEELGYWQLSTKAPLVYHLGNTLGSSDVPEISEVLYQNKIESGDRPKKGESYSGIKDKIKRKMKQRVQQSMRLQNLLKRWYNYIFYLLFEEK